MMIIAVLFRVSVRLILVETEGYSEVLTDHLRNYQIEYLVFSYFYCLMNFDAWGGSGDDFHWVGALLYGC